MLAVSHVYLGFAIAYALMSVVAFGFYAVDKSRAGIGKRRIPEATLHLLELLFGWPGALAGQQLLRHKTRKLSYQVVFWLIVILHVGAWGWWLVR